MLATYLLLNAYGWQIDQLWLKFVRVEKKLNNFVIVLKVIGNKNLVSFLYLKELLKLWHKTLLQVTSLFRPGRLRCAIAYAPRIIKMRILPRASFVLRTWNRPPPTILTPFFFYMEFYLSRASWFHDNSKYRYRSLSRYIYRVST